MKATFEKFRHQLAYLGDPRFTASTNALSAGFSNAVAPLCETGIIAPGLMQAIEMDLLYCVIRHRLWLATPLFGMILADHVATTFHLPQELARSIAGGIIAVGRQNLATNAADSDEFLTYVCIATATAADEESLLLDLGFGRSLLLRIKEALGLMTPKGDQSTRYLPELDAQIARIVTSIADELQESPWALQRRRLHYLLLDSEGPWCDAFLNHGTDWVFELLLKLSQQRVMHSRELAKVLANLLPIAPEFHGERMVTLLCRLLAARGLMAPEGQRTWRNLTLASELTAAAFAAKWSNDTADLRAEIPKLDAYFQASLIQQRIDDTDLLTETITDIRPLTPLGLKTACRRLMALKGHEATRLLLQNALPSEASFCLRDAIVEILSELDLAVGQNQNKVAKSPNGPHIDSSI